MKNHIYYYFFTALVLFVLLLFIKCIYTQIGEYYSQLDPVLITIKNSIQTLNPIVENLHFFEGEKSYTINKKKIYLCLKDEQGEYYDMNMLIYVAIHELSHVLCDEIGHTPKFYKIFQEQLDKATELGLYDPNKPIISNYCGHT
jgi:hypothetical protein